MLDENQPVDCERCGQAHARCTAHNRAGNPCRRHRLPGQRVCGMHGGRTPVALEAAARRVAERQAVLAAETFGLPREVDPHTALLEELHRTAGAVQWLGAIVADLDRGDLVWGLVKETHGAQADEGTQVAVVKESRPNAFVELWQRERKHLLEVSRACIAAGIEERRVRLAEAAGQQLAAAVRAVLDRLGLTDDQRALALQVVPEELRRAGDPA